MTETIVQDEICPNCGTELPAVADFCFHCGNSIKADSTAGNDSKEVSDAWLRGDISDSNQSANQQNDLPVQGVTTVENKPGENFEKDLSEVKSDQNSQIDGIVATQERSDITELESAAALRVKAKRKRVKKVEIRWEEPDYVPNLRFISGAIILIIFVAVIFILAMYLR